MIEGLVVGLLFAVVAALALQVASAVTTSVDAAAMRDSDEPDAATRTRIQELFWSLAVLAPVAVFVAFAIDGAARLVWDEAQQVWGLVVLLCTAAAAFLAGAVGVVGIIKRERPTYARLRRDLRDRSAVTLSAEDLTGFQSRLDRADELRDRAGRGGLALGIFGLILVLAVGGFLAFVFFVVGSPWAWAFAGGTALHVVAFVVGLRAAAVLRVRTDAVLEAQRDEVVALLERARIPQRGRVPGVRDRVARALAILREKQR
jgi:hypothetical protein